MERWIWCRNMSHHFTPVPDIIFDSLLTHFSGAELKVFMIVIRKTLGWYDPKTRRSKERDWIALSQFQGYTGLSNVSIWKAIDSLSKGQYILVTDRQGNVLLGAEDRKGKRQLYYQPNPTLLNFLF